MGEVVRHRRFFMDGDAVIRIGWVNQRLDVNHPQPSVVVRDIEAAVPAAAVALVGALVGYEVGAVKIVRGEEEPFVLVRMGFAISTIAMVFSIGNFPIANQFGFEFELAVFHGVFSGVNEVHDAGADVGAECLHRSGDQMNGFIGITDVGEVNHRWERFSVVDVGNTPPVLVPGWTTVWLAITVQVKEIHPQTDFRCSPSAHEGVAETRSASGCVNRIGFG